MARPRKYRRVCRMPEANRFGPLGQGRGRYKPLTMTVDEYEVIRLLDYEGFTQEEASIQMDVARTTVQRIYMIARRKLADMLVNQRVIQIEGGDFLLCEELGPDCTLECHSKNNHHPYHHHHRSATRRTRRERYRIDRASGYTGYHGEGRRRS
ncbi:MAG: DUF134 domain-containing protein [Anaerovoracaceae bacterium]